MPRLIWVFAGRTGQFLFCHAPALMVPDAWSTLCQFNMTRLVYYVSLLHNTPTCMQTHTHTYSVKGAPDPEDTHTSEVYTQELTHEPENPFFARSILDCLSATRVPPVPGFITSFRVILLDSEEQAVCKTMPKYWASLYLRTSDSCV